MAVCGLIRKEIAYRSRPHLYAAAICSKQRPQKIRFRMIGIGVRRCAQKRVGYGGSGTRGTADHDDRPVCIFCVSHLSFLNLGQSQCYRQYGHGITCGAPAPSPLPSRTTFNLKQCTCSSAETSVLGTRRTLFCRVCHIILGRQAHHLRCLLGTRFINAKRTEIHSCSLIPAYSRKSVGLVAFV